jgi:hypothetical protein
VADDATAGPNPHPDDGKGGQRSQARHGERHELLIASLLDRDLPAGDRLVAEGLLRTCPACVDLHADLVLLSKAARNLPAPTRPRDYRLTTADAARLDPARAARAEPRGAAARLTGEMHPSADHDRHDQLLIASLLDRSTGGAGRDRGEALLAACVECATLHRDLVSLRDAARALPTPPRTREFLLTTDDAARLRRTGWRRLLAVVGSTRDAFSRPLAVGLTTLGLVGFLAASIPGALSVGSGSTSGVPTLGQAAGGAGANAESAGEPKAAAAATAAPSAAPSFAAAQLAPPAGSTTAPAPVAASPAADQPSGEAFDTFVGSPDAAAIAPGADASTQYQAGSTQAASTRLAALSEDRNPLLAVAGLLLAAGVGLFVLRWAARRV